MRCRRTLLLSLKYGDFWQALIELDANCFGQGGDGVGIQRDSYFRIIATGSVQEMMHYCGERETGTAIAITLIQNRQVVDGLHGWLGDDLHRRLVGAVAQVETIRHDVADEGRRLGG